MDFAESQTRHLEFLRAAPLRMEELEDDTDCSLAMTLPMPDRFEARHHKPQKENAMYATEFPAQIIQMNIPKWNLGDVFFTEGVFSAVESGRLSSDELLGRHLQGDYGLVNADPTDLSMTNEARRAGRSFTSLYELGVDHVKVVTHPSPQRTIMCLASED